MNIAMISVQSAVPQPWRNGGGQTRELLAWPSGPDWRVRISRADIEADGPFSAYAGVTRWFAVLQGAGVALTLDESEQRVVPGDAPLCFDGALAPGCRLIDGPTQDLNLMLRQGNGAMRAVRAGQSWQEPFAMRGLYTTAAGQWRGGPQHAVVAPDTLLWCEDSGQEAWTFEPAAGNPSAGAWWLGFSPRDER